MEPAYRYRALISRIIDADTLDARIDVGFRMYAEVPLRLYAIDAPEARSAAGQAAADFTMHWLAERMGQVIVATYKAPEKYGRWLAEVHDPMSGETLNEALLRTGHAKAWHGRGPRP